MIATDSSYIILHFRLFYFSAMILGCIISHNKIEERRFSEPFSPWINILSPGRTLKVTGPITFSPSCEILSDCTEIRLCFAMIFIESKLNNNFILHSFRFIQLSRRRDSASRLPYWRCALCENYRLTITIQFCGCFIDAEFSSRATRYSHFLLFILLIAVGHCLTKLRLASIYSS